MQNETIETASSEPRYTLKYAAKNKLRNIEELKKVRWDSFRQIALSQNRIGDLLALTKMNTMFSCIIIEYYSDNHELVSNLSVLIKLFKNSDELRELHFKSKERIEQKKLKAILKKKNPQVSIMES